MIVRTRINDLGLIIALDINSLSVASKMYAVTGKWYYMPFGVFVTAPEMQKADILPVLSPAQLSALLYEETRGWLSRRINDDEKVKTMTEALSPAEAFLKPMLE